MREIRDEDVDRRRKEEREERGAHTRNMYMSTYLYGRTKGESIYISRIGEKAISTSSLSRHPLLTCGPTSEFEGSVCSAESIIVEVLQKVYEESPQPNTVPEFYINQQKQSNR
ncbi:hypothetical protein CHS0354_034543 [Potamilus streckersoni]|uniref:Uncharacterized protein n=1 Tax=Potamilus streckersoni TaxID=2493646 RepID=A0AAE0WB19_9BIVA|nr:hypothetical protein CHS0354_034543 [Potamilus streckersoni]